MNFSVLSKKTLIRIALPFLEVLHFIIMTLVAIAERIGPPEAHPLLDRRYPLAVRRYVWRAFMGW